jgi:hypothetical protein
MVTHIYMYIYIYLFMTIDNYQQVFITGFEYNDYLCVFV